MEFQLESSLLLPISTTQDFSLKRFIVSRSKDQGHASPLAVKFFQKRNGQITPFGSSQQCAFVASGISFYSVQAARLYSDFLGIDFPEESYQRIFKALGLYIIDNSTQIRENS